MNIAPPIEDGGTELVTPDALPPALRLMTGVASGGIVQLGYVDPEDFASADDLATVAAALVAHDHDADYQRLDAQLTSLAGLEYSGNGAKVIAVTAGEDGFELVELSAGDASGPESSTDNAIARFDGTGGKTLQNSGATVNDSGNITCGSIILGAGTAASPATRFAGAYPANGGTGIYMPAGSELAIACAATYVGGWSLIGLHLPGVVELTQVSSGGTPATNSGRIYALDVAGTAEMHVKDEAGNETQISPHAMDGPASLYDPTDPQPHVVKESNEYLGGVRYLNESRACYLLEELLKAIRNGATLAQIRTALQNKDAAALDLYHVESFAQHNARTGSTLVKLDWDTVQDQHQATYDAERAAELDAHAEWEALPEEERPEEPTVRRAADIRKPKPAWIAAREEN